MYTGSPAISNIIFSDISYFLQLAASESSSSAPVCVGKTIEDASLALENVDKIQCNLEELNSSVDEHNEKVDVVIEQLNSLNNTVKELEHLMSYIKWLQEVEDLRYA